MYRAQILLSAIGLLIVAVGANDYTDSKRKRSDRNYALLRHLQTGQDAGRNGIEAAPKSGDGATPESGGGAAQGSAGTDTSMKNEPAAGSDGAGNPFGSVDTDASWGVSMGTKQPSIAPSIMLQSDMPSNSPSLSPTFIPEMVYDVFINSHFIGRASFERGDFVIDGLPFWLNRAENSFSKGDVICLYDISCAKENCRFHCHTLTKDDLPSSGSAWKVSLPSKGFEKTRMISDALFVNDEATGRVESNSIKFTAYAEAKLFPGDKICFESPSWRYVKDCKTCVRSCHTLTSNDMTVIPSREITLAFEDF